MMKKPFFNLPESLNAKVFVSARSNEDKSMISLMKEMTKALKDRSVNGLPIKEKVLRNETRTSVVPAAFSQGYVPCTT
jgi:hypothetical protein